MRLTPAEVELQRVRIIESAINEFAKKGYAATRMEDIAKKAGISRSPLYYHFNSKKDLFDEVFDIYCRKLEEAEEAAYKMDGSFFDRLYRCIVDSIQVMDADIGKLSNNLQSHKEELEKSCQRYELMHRRSKELKIRMYTEAVKSGELVQDCDPEMLYDLSFLIFRGAMARKGSADFIKYDNERIECVVKEFVEMVRNYYGKE